MPRTRAEVCWVGLIEHADRLGPDPALAGLTDQQVEQQVRDGAARIASAMCGWLEHVAELVARGVWADTGARTPGQWLSWACGVAGVTAREYVRVGLALRSLPLTRRRFAAGTLSFSKVRAISRVASPELEEWLLELADTAPASHLERIISHSRGQLDELERWADGPPDLPGPDAWDWQQVPIDEEIVELRIRLPRADAEAAAQRLDRLVDLADRDQQQEHDGDGDAADGDAACGDGADGDGQATIDAAAQTPAGPAGDAAGDTDPGVRPSRGERRARMLADVLADQVARGRPDRSGDDDHVIVLHVDPADLATTDLSDSDTDDAAVPADPDKPERDNDDAAAGPAATVASDPDGIDRDSDDAAAGPAPATDGPTTGQPDLRQRRAMVVTGRDRAMRIPRSVLHRLTCDAVVRVPDGGHPADIGRKSRVVPADLRRALRLRDRHCRFPGCGAVRHLHAHHVIHWAHGGPTDLDNLTLICAFHHRFVHDRHWTLTPIAGQPGRWTFHPPNHPTPLPPCRPLPGIPDPVTAETGTHGNGVAGVTAGVTAVTPPPRALEPPWWDAGPWDLSETIRVVSVHLHQADPKPRLGMPPVPPPTT